MPLKVRQTQRTLMSALIGLVSASLFSCASQKQMQQSLDELLYLRGQLQQLHRRLDDQQATLTQLQTILFNTNQLQKELWSIEDSLQTVQANLDRLRADLTSEIATVKEYANYLNNKFDDVGNRSGKLLGKVETLTQKIADRTTFPATSANAPTGTAAMELFNSAYLDMTRGNYQLAQQGFNAYLELFPNSELADYCHFYLAEIAYQIGDYSQASSEYQLVLTRYPNSSKIPNTLLKLGICYKQLNDPNKARQYFNELITKYPNTEEAAQARARL